MWMRLYDRARRSGAVHLNARRILTMLSLGAAAVALLGACGPTTAASHPIVYDLQPVIFPYVTAQDNGIFSEAKKLGLKIVYANANGSETSAIAQINDGITAHAAGIVINPLSSTALVPAISRAIKAGICVVAVTDNFGPNTGVVYPPGAKGYVGWNEFYSGSLAGAWIAKKIGYSGDVAVEVGDIAHGASAWRYRGALSVWKKYPGIHVVSVEQYNFNLDTIRSQVLDLVTHYGTALKGILIDTNPGSVVAINAINTTIDKNKVAIASVGGEKAMIQLIAQGYPAADIPEVPVQEGIEGVKLVYQCIHGNKKPVDFLEQYLPGVSVLKPYNYTIDSSDLNVFKPDW